jgi:hypothetical protein
MADAIDETRIIAWIDGELPADEAAQVAALVAADPTLAALADRHRRLRARFATAFAPLAEPKPVPKVISLAAVRAAKQSDAATPRRAQRWAWPGAIAASLLLGLLIGQHQVATGIGDRQNALALDRSIAAALDTQASGNAGAVRIALSFRNKQGDYCRGFSASHLSGIACRVQQGWTLRYGGQGEGATSDYRMATGNAPMMAAVGAMIDGEALDRDGEAMLLKKGWR